MFTCLLLPNFRLQAALRWREVAGSAAVVDEQTDLLLEVNAEAFAHGITPGQTGPQAMARDGRIRLLPPAPAQEECLNNLLLDRALNLAPDVERTAPGAVIADVSRAAKTLCWQQLADTLIAQFRAEALNLQVGVASTPDLALLAARGADPAAIVYDASAFVAPLPIIALEPSETVRQILADWGITTVGDLLRLPRSGVVERLGAEAEGQLQRVSGRHKRPLRLVRQRPEYAEAFDFDYEVETSAPLLFLLRRFLNDLTARLREAGRVARQMELVVPLDDGSRHARTFCIPSPTADVEVLFRILDTHLETLQLPQRPTGLRLRLEDTVPARDQLQLFESALRDPNLFGETLARLKAFLGNDAVGVPIPADTHEPDRFTMGEFFSPTVAAVYDRRIISNDGLAAAGSPLQLRGLPLRRCRPAPPARVVTQDGRPFGVTSEIATGAVSRWAGPYRLSGAWWDVQAWEIEEWDVELEDGEMFRLARRGRRWTVEGCYEA
jgi:protein ImuB